MKSATRSGNTKVRSCLAAPDDVDAVVACITGTYGHSVRVIEQQYRFGDDEGMIALEFDTIADIPQIKSSVAGLRCARRMSDTLLDQPITANPYL
ncbi:hypothetical protein [Gordonia malaquae]|uniref:hypothetical protein n=1 Tax=Gordonia malaquae TaxID=410332 RepID=UPI00301A5A83